MAIKRVGRDFLEVVDEDGLRNLVRINAIQRISDVDEMAEETYLTVASKVLLVRSPLDEFRKLIEGSSSGRHDLTTGMTV
jgi:hypothetical protein